MICRSFYFIRHGQTDWNKEHRLQGHIDIPLNETGKREAEEAIPFLQTLPVNRIIASPLKRAYETAIIVNRILKKPMEVDDRLRERHFGIFEGKTKSEIEAWKEENNFDDADSLTSSSMEIPEGEIYTNFHDRIIQVKNEVLRKYPEENILFVSHGGVYRVLCRALDLEVNQSPNAKPFHFICEELLWKLVG